MGKNKKWQKFLSQGSREVNEKKGPKVKTKIKNIQEILKFIASSMLFTICYLNTSRLWVRASQNYACRMIFFSR